MTDKKLIYKFHTDLEKGKKRILSIIEEKIVKLQKRYDELLMVDINMDTGEKDSTPYDVKSTVIFKTKLKDFTAIKVNKNPLISLREAIAATEIQLKKHLEKLTSHHTKHLKDAEK